ncbi:hypothetical protein L6452_31053 [Arctium lappa]|uniref:Uncharacterized protein n=1 Tax=Arctium lappa TaxID=4217 RepID=A0ACB8ZK72_ARCLA|nr:hypothetical protein L6452_31053 [Arctium lappa]
MSETYTSNEIELEMPQRLLRHSLRSMLPPNPDAPFRMRNFEGTSGITTGSITAPGPAAARTPCLLNSSNTKPEVIVSDQPTPASRLGERKNNTIAKRSSQIRASQIIKDKTTLGIEHSRSRKLLGNVLISRVPPATPMAVKNQITNEVVIHNPLSRVPPATPMAVAARNQIADHEKVSKMRSSTPPASSIRKQFLNSKINGSKSFTTVKAEYRNPFETTRKDQILPRYMPKLTDQELKQISRGSKTKVTPLFEKKLTASDAGRIGRLVLPKRCAEAYFPPVLEPLGEPLIIQDVEGKDWELNFRFWPNNNSRMYVLEGFSPLVKSMDLEEGDTVTFSRLEPEGKLVMGYRKAKIASSSNQTMVTVSPRNDVPKGYTSSATSIQSEVVRAKRKSSKMGPTSKIIEPEKEMIELDLTSKEAQELVRPHPCSHVPKPVFIDGVEIMAYKDDPVIARPTIIEYHDGKLIQWAQCEGCYKWRKVASDVVIPAGWTCSLNQWDPQRSRCSAREEMMSNKTIKKIFSRTSDEGESSKRMKIGNHQSEPPEAVVDQDAVAVVPLTLPSPAKATTKHPRHRPGCSCVVCSQAPSGTKHNSTCTCGGCMTLRRRHQTVNSRRGKKPTGTGTIRRKRTRRPENTRKSAVSQKKPTPQPPADSVMKQAELGVASSSHQLLKPAQQPTCILKPPIPILQTKKPTEDHQPSKTTSASLPAGKPERRLLDLNRLPESDDEDSMQ